MNFNTSFSVYASSFLVEMQYAQTDQSSYTDAPGMREAQAMVYAQN